MSDLFDFNFADNVNEEVSKADDEDTVEELPGSPVALSVGQAVDVINDALFRVAGPDLIVEGEVSEYSVSQGKWIRFVLKDLEGGAILKCFLTIYQMQVDIKDGDRIIVHATPKIYPKYGQFTLNINSIELAGEGDLKAALLRLRKQLEGEGLFDEGRKRELPATPSRIGIITSRDAAAYTDFLRILGNRWGGVDVELAHVNVQGERAVGQICGALQYFNDLDEADRPDVLVLTRGGGGLEDLMAFNAEAVVRAVFSSKVPIVVGIGHERDESLAELAADVRASTPSNAAERIVPDREAVIGGIGMTLRRMGDRVEELIRDRAHKVETATSTITHGMSKVSFMLDRTVTSVEHAGEILLHRIDSMKSHIDGYARLIKEMNPERVLARGYSIVKRDGKVVKDATRLDKGAQLQVQFAKGSVDTEVIQVNG